MNRKDNHRLLLEVLTGAELDSLRERSLARGLAAARARRGRRRLLQAGIIGTLVLAAVSASVLTWRARGPVPTSNTPRAIAAARPVVEQATDRVKIISDNELFALFPNRPLALIGPVGHQRLVFLDEAPPEPR